MTDKRADFSGNGGPRPAEREDDGRRTRSGHPFEIRDGERDRVMEWGRFMTARQIGLALRGPDEPISKDTILRHFKAELEYAKAHLIQAVGGKMLEAALAGNVHSGMAFLKWFGEPDQFVERHKLTGPGGGPIQVADLGALADLSLEKLRALQNAAAILSGDTEQYSEGTATVPSTTGPDSGGD